MSYKHILLHLDSTAIDTGRIASALNFAAKHGAFVTGLFCQTDPGMSAIVGTHPVSEALKTAAQDMDQAFMAAAKEKGVNTTFEARLCTTHQQVVEMVTRFSHCADLVIVGQYDWSKNNPALPTDLAENVIVHSGRPTLVLPFTGAQKDIGSRCLIAWNNAREAARALGDSMPILKTADSVEIFAIHKDGDASISEESLLAHLTYHGISAQTTHDKKEKISISNMVLSQAADSASTLIVMGGYGHYGVSQMLRGSNTRDMLKQLTVPLLMAH